MHNKKNRIWISKSLRALLIIDVMAARRKLCRLLLFFVILIKAREHFWADKRVCWTNVIPTSDVNRASDVCYLFKYDRRSFNCSLKNELERERERRRHCARFFLFYDEWVRYMNDLIGEQSNSAGCLNVAQTIFFLWVNVVVVVVFRGINEQSIATFAYIPFTFVERASEILTPYSFL